MPNCYLISSRWCALVARACIRLGYRACVITIIGLTRMCADLASVMPTEMGLNLPLEQMVQGPLEVNSTPELEVVEREGQQEDSVEESVPEDPEVGVVGAMEETEVELSVLESESERVEDNEAEMEEDSEIDLSVDNRPEYWEWAHDWEDLDWSEDIWVEDELVSVDLNEATIPDELWE